MSTDFQTKLIMDDRLQVQPNIDYGVCVGAQNVSQVQYNAVSQSNSSHTYTIQVPNETTIVSRYVVWESTVKLRITANAPVTPNLFEFQYGAAEAFAPFPLHQLCSTISCTINNNTVSTNMQSVLPAILRMLPQKANQELNGSTPVYLDKALNYEDVLLSNNNSLAAYQNGLDAFETPRGSFLIDSVKTSAGLDFDPSDNTPANAISWIEVSATFREPLLISPFLFAKTPNDQGFYGVNNIQLVMNIDSTASRAYRVANFILDYSSPPNAAFGARTRRTAGYSYSLSPNGGFSNSRLLFEFLTPKAGAMTLAPRNVVPYYELNRYFTNAGNWTLANNTRDFTSTTLQLNQIPDKIAFWISPKTLGVNNTDSSLVINNVSISFNNSSGLVSSATARDLWRMSVRNGSNQSWEEFSGFANYYNGGVAAPANKANLPVKIPTVGSLVILSFGEDIECSSLDAASGLLGNFNLTLKINATFQQTVSYNFAQFATPAPFQAAREVGVGSGGANVECQLTLVVINSGAFVCNKGTSSVFTGLLSRDDVLKSLTQEPNFMHTTNRMVGGGFFDTLKGVVNKVAPVAKAVMSIIPHEGAQKGAKALGALGYGESGGRKGMKKGLEDRLM